MSCAYFAVARGDELDSSKLRDYKDEQANIDRQHFLVTKSALLHALGNAGHAHSIDHIIAHAYSDHMQHTEIRHTAIKALRKYTCQQVCLIVMSCTCGQAVVLS